MNVVYCKNKNQDPNLKTPKGLLHSAYSPQIEAQRQAQQIVDLAQKSSVNLPILILGLGWGYLLDALLDFKDAILSKENLFFLEPHIEIQAIWIEHKRLDFFLKKGVHIYFSIEELLVKVSNKNSFLYYFHPRYKTYFPEIIDSINKNLNQKIHSNDKLKTTIDTSTIKYFLGQWLRNSFCNYKFHTALSYIIKKKEGVPNHLPIIYIGAAPNLEEEFLYLKKIHAIIISSDTALAPLLFHNIKIDLVISIDSSHASFYHLVAASYFQKNKALYFDIPVLTWGPSPTLLHKIFSKVLYYRSSFPLDQILGTRQIEGLETISKNKKKSQAPSSLHLSQTLPPKPPLEHIVEWKNPTRNTLGLAIQLTNILGGSELFCLGTNFRTHKGLSHTSGTGYHIYSLEKLQRTYGPYNYKARGYESKLNEKNSLAIEEAKLQAKHLGIKLSFTLRNFSTHSHFQKIENIETLLEIEKVPTKNIRNYLKHYKIQIGDFFEKGTLEGLALSSKRINKILSLLD